MADETNSQDLLTRAQSLLNERLALVEAHKQNVDAEQGARAALAEAERRSAHSWNAMLTAGWSAGELRHLGFKEPSVRTPGRPRKAAARKPAAVESAASVLPAQAPSPSFADAATD